MILPLKEERKIIFRETIHPCFKIKQSIIIICVIITLFTLAIMANIALSGISVVLILDPAKVHKNKVVQS